MSIGAFVTELPAAGGDGGGGYAILILYEILRCLLLWCLSITSFLENN